MAGRSQRRWRLIGAAVGALCLAGSLGIVIAALWAKGIQSATNLAGLVSLGLAIPGMLVSLVMQVKRAGPSTRMVATRDIVHAKDALAVSVTNQWRAEAVLRSLDDPDPMPIRWRLTRHVEAMDHAENVAIEPLLWAGSSDEIAELADQFRSLRRRRLVILGEPGSGKTTLAVQLLLHLLSSRDDGEPVPLLLSVAGWNIEKLPQLHDWLAVRLAQDHPGLGALGLGTDIPKKLAAGGHVLPILDGLDEVPEAVRPAVIAAINGSLAGHHQLILTSRTSEFTRAIEEGTEVITSAAVIEPDPLAPASAAEYLRRCLPPAAGAEWEQILAGLRADHHHPGPSAELAKVTSTPLGLWLLRTVYVDPGDDPRRLLESDRLPDAAAIRTHLLDELIESVIITRLPVEEGEAETFRPRRLWDPCLVDQWLGYLAGHLGRVPTMDGQKGVRDFAWWQLARQTVQPRTLSSLAGLTVGLALAIIPAFIGGLLGWFAGNHDGIIAGVHSAWMGAAAASLIGLIFGLPIGFGVEYGVRIGFNKEKLDREQPPSFADLRISGRVHLLAGIAIGKLWIFLIVGSVTAVFAYLYSKNWESWSVLAFGGISGCLAWLVASLLTWAETPAPANHLTSPLISLRADRTLNLLKLASFGLIVALVIGPMLVLVLVAVIVGLVFSVAYGGLQMIPVVIIFLFGLGLSAGPTLASTGRYVFGSHYAWIMYAVAVRELAREKKLPRHLMSFLDDTHRLGLLRAVGPVYQFRHAELQDHLASKYRDRLH